jgi:hypothetical protein
MRAFRLVNGRVHQHDPSDVLSMLLGPTKRYGTPPIVGDGDNLSRQAEFIGQSAQIIDAATQTADGSRALRIPHVQLIDRDHTHIIRCRCKKIPPEI